MIALSFQQPCVDQQAKLSVLRQLPILQSYCSSVQLECESYGIDGTLVSHTLVPPTSPRLSRRRLFLFIYNIRQYSIQMIENTNYIFIFEIFYSFNYISTVF